MTKHTPEPWDEEFTAPLIKAGSDIILIGPRREAPLVDCRLLSEENYQRAKQCVNACAGIDHPEEAIRMMKSVRVGENGSPDFGQVISQMQALKAENERLRYSLDELQAFKNYVHKRLDDAGIPTHPEGEHSKAGCRIGDRLDIVLSGGDKAENARLRDALQDAKNGLQWYHDEYPSTYSREDMEIMTKIDEALKGGNNESK